MFDCVFIGDIFIDIIISGLSSDISLFKGGINIPENISVHHGGVGNIAVGLQRLGGVSYVVGKSGKDLFGDSYELNLVEEKIEHTIFNDEISNTGLAITLLDKNGERTFIIKRGANDLLNEQEITLLSKIIAKSKLLYITGYSLVKNPQIQAVLKSISIAKKNDVKIIFDPGSYNLINENRDLFIEVLNKCDIFVPNYDEAKAITNKTDKNEIINQLKGKVDTIALKMGDYGCLLYHNDQFTECISNQISCLDTTGAGDAFISAFIYGLLNNYELREIGELANWYAGSVIQDYGARSFPESFKIQNYLKKIKRNRN